MQQERKSIGYRKVCAINNCQGLQASLDILIAGDGVFSLLEDSYIKLVDLTTNTTTNVVSLHDITDVSDLNTLFNHVRMMFSGTWTTSCYLSLATVA